MEKLFEIKIKIRTQATDNIELWRSFSSFCKIGGIDGWHIVYDDDLWSSVFSEEECRRIINVLTSAAWGFKPDDIRVTEI